MTPADESIERLNIVAQRAARLFRPPKDQTVSEWAEENRWLSRESSAEPGPWRTARTPYLREPLDAFTDPGVHKIVMVSASQVGKSELELNVLGYIIDQDPGSILYIQPSLDDGRKFSRLRIAPMIRDCPALKSKVADVKSKDSGNTILQKSFPGGMLTITGSNSASSLASTPVRYVIGDELDRWAASAGTEGDPWALAEARQTTFYNAKSIAVSTPTVRGHSKIEKMYFEGTQERWCHQCPECGAWHSVEWNDIKFDHTKKETRGKKTYTVSDIGWACPSCGCFTPEAEMRRQPAKWIADAPEMLEKGIRSFWLNAFASPWTSWTKIALRYLEANGIPEEMQVVYNTLLGQLWEDRGDVDDEDTFLARREDYGTNGDGSPVELPEGVIVLTCGVDNQDDRLEYEVVGHGMYGETWGIQKGVIWGKPDTPEPWLRLDDVITRRYRFRSGKALSISLTFVDSGGHYSQEVYQACRDRLPYRVFAIKGREADGVPYTAPPRKNKIVVKGRVIGACWLHIIGVNAGKEHIMSSLKVQAPGPKYCHFPLGETRGYDYNYFNQLLSEKLSPVKGKNGAVKWQWVKLPGHPHNEALDCRNYALAAFRFLNPDMDAEARRLRGLPEAADKKARRETPRRSRRNNFDSEW